MIKTIKATVPDSTHLELSQPIPVQQGAYIKICIVDDKEDVGLWQEVSKKHLFKILILNNEGLTLLFPLPILQLTISSLQFTNLHNTTYKMAPRLLLTKEIL